jgi:hypothetical protein
LTAIRKILNRNNPGPIIGSVAPPQAGVLHIVSWTVARLERMKI